MRPAKEHAAHPDKRLRIAEVRDLIYFLDDPSRQISFPADIWRRARQRLDDAITRPRRRFHQWSSQLLPLHCTVDRVEPPPVNVVPR